MKPSELQTTLKLESPARGKPLVAAGFSGGLTISLITLQLTARLSNRETSFSFHQDGFYDSMMFFLQ